MAEIVTAKHSALVNTGPSGRAMAEPMNPELLSLFHQHLNMERQAHTAYFAAAIWFAERELRGFAQLFRDESNNEHQHAAKFSDYLIAHCSSSMPYPIAVATHAPPYFLIQWLNSKPNLNMNLPTYWVASALQMIKHPLFC